MANAGVDRSNVSDAQGRDVVLLLPRDPDESAQKLRQEMLLEWDARVGIIISDSFGRPWRNGVVNIALGVAGLPALIDRRGEVDRHGRRLEVTEVAMADALAAGAAMVMGEGAESIPVVLARGLSWNAPETNGSALIRSRNLDLFR
jgi:coenzyme F420-0:L-glutamate ligase/coenzyme F420-1:gamma-L-glutamate ligase